MPQLHSYVEVRLDRWAKWLRWGGHVGPDRVVSWYEKMIMAPNVQGRGGDTQPCPVNEAEAFETHKTVCVLAEHLRDTVVECYLWSGTAEMKAAKLGICRDQYYARLATAKTKLLGYLNDLAADIPLPAPESSHKKAKIRRNKKHLTLPDSFRTFPATVA